MSEGPVAFSKRFPNIKAPTYQKRCSDTLLTLSFLQHNGSGGLIVRGYDPLTDKIYDTLPVLAEDWRSFGFGKFSSLKAKHRDILYNRILNGLELLEGELRLTWVWVVEARAMREKKAKAEYNAVLLLQCFFRCCIVRTIVKNARDQKRAATALQSQARRRIAANFTSRKRSVLRSTITIQSCIRRLKAKAAVDVHRTNTRAALSIQTRIRAHNAQKNFGTYKVTTLAARLLQRAIRCHQAYSKLAQKEYDKEQGEIRIREERERAAQRAREMAHQFARDRADLIAHEKKAAHVAWKKRAAKEARAKKQRLQQEEDEKRLKEERIKEEREQNIQVYRTRIAEREREKRKKLRKMQRLLEKQARERGENPASTFFPKLAMAMGKPLDISYYERALAGKRKPAKKKIKKRKDPFSPTSRYAHEIEASIRHMKRDMKIKVKKKSPKRKGMKGPPSDNPNTYVRGYDQQKFFLSKKERKMLSQIDSSPVKPTKLPQI